MYHKQSQVRPLDWCNLVFLYSRDFVVFVSKHTVSSKPITRLPVTTATSGRFFVKGTDGHILLLCAISINLGVFDGAVLKFYQDGV